MRALITLIAILTVGIVTAQIDPDTYRGDISYNHNNETISVPNAVGDGSTTYTVVGDLERNLNIHYENGSDHVYHYLREIDLIENHLVSWDYRHVIGSSNNNGGNGRQHYRLLAVVNDGSGNRNISFHVQQAPTEEIITSQNRLDATIYANRGTPNDRYAYAVRYRFSLYNYFGAVEAGIGLTFELPERFSGYGSANHDLVILASGLHSVNHLIEDSPNVTSPLFDLTTILTDPNRPTYTNLNSPDRGTVQIFRGEGNHIGPIVGGRHIPFTFEYKPNHIVE